MMSIGQYIEENELDLLCEFALDNSEDLVNAFICERYPHILEEYKEARLRDWERYVINDYETSMAFNGKED